MALLSVRGLSKSYGATSVLRGVDLDLFGGEVHVLAGENGAGKSTLIKALAGALDGFSGTIALEGRPVRFSSPAEARAAGVATIFQELSLVGTLSVVDNLFLGRERTGLFGVQHAAQRDLCARHLERLGIAVDPAAIVEELPLATRQLVEIAKALLDERVRVVVMDEPSSALGEHEAEALFAQVARLRAAGAAVLYVSHKMEEVYRLADRITALRDGTVAATAKAADLPRAALVAAMLGRSLDESVAAATSASAGVRLAVDGLAADHDGRRAIEGVSFSVAPGEIVALTGLAGAGAKHVLHALYGSLARAAGAVTLDGAPFAPRGPADALARGVTLLSDDRRDAGILPDRSVVENAALASLDRYTRLGLVRERALREGVLAGLRAMDVRAPSPDVEITALSGGNQQKVLLARCLLAAPRVLLLDEPTRGVDVGSKQEIHARLRALCAEGASIVAVTTEAEELLALADRVVVLHRGRVTRTLPVRGQEPAEVRRAVLAAAMGAEAA